MLRYTSRRRIGVLSHRQRLSQISPQKIIIALIPNRQNFPAVIHQPQSILGHHPGKSSHFSLGFYMINDNIVIFFFHNTATDAADTGGKPYLHIRSRHRKSLDRIHCRPVKLRILRKDKHPHGYCQNQNRRHRRVEDFRLLYNELNPLLHTFSTTRHGSGSADQIREPPFFRNDGKQCLPIRNPFLLSQKKQSLFITGQFAIPFGAGRRHPHQRMKPVHCH